MPRFAPTQPDLFVAPVAASASPAKEDPIAELEAMLVRFRAMDAPPWPTITAAMQDEYRVLYLARQAGDPGAPLASAVFAETERLLAMTD